MRRTMLGLLVTVCTFPVLGAEVNSQTAATISTVVSEIKTVLVDVQPSLKVNGLPLLSSAKLTLETTYAKKVGGGFTFWIVSIGGSWEKDKSQQIELTLVPPPPAADTKTAAKLPSFVQELYDAIISVAKGVAESKSETIPLTPKSLVVNLKFTVTTDGSGKATLVPLNLNFNGDLKNTSIQTIQLTFGK